jgi:hypothetical protein
MFALSGALAAGLALLPLALSGSKPGYLGGLFTSTLLNLLVLPVLYERYGRSKAVMGFKLCSFWTLISFQILGSRIC